LLGPNGAGKSTTVKILTTLSRPDAGSASVAGVNVLEHPGEVRRVIGCVAQKNGVDLEATARENLALQGQLYGMRGTDTRRRVDELLARFELSRDADRPARTFSGGMLRKLGVALGLVHRPAVLFLDEPTTGLDPASRLTVWDEVRRINGTGTTVFLTTQYLEEADKLCDRLAIIDGGRIVAEGTPKSLKAEMGHDVVSVSLDGADPAATRAALADLPGLERVIAETGALALYLEDGGGSIAEIVRRLDREGIEVAAIALARPSLDDVFLQATGRRLEEGDQEREREEVAVP